MSALPLLRQRPAPGRATTSEVRIPICAKCGYAIMDGLCADPCPLDGNSHKGHTIIAVYSRVDTFLRDEEGDR
jgi:hypothetical protein